MQPKDRQFLEANRHFVEVYSLYPLNPANISMRDLEVMKRISYDYFSKDYHPDIWCSDCIPGVIKFIYDSYDKLLKDEARK